MRRIVSGICALMTAFSAAGCYSMRPVTFDQLGTTRPGAVWITREDQSVVVVETPRIFGDTLVGYVNGEFQELPNTDMREFRVKRMATAKTAGLITAAAVAAGTFVVIVTGTGNYIDPAANLDCDDDPYQPGCPLANP